MKFLFFVLLAFPFLSWAAAPDNEELRARTIYGDRDVRFLAKNENGKVTIERLIDGDNLISRELTVKEWKYLVREFRKLPISKAMPPECGRARMDLVLIQSAKQTVRFSCFGVRTITSDSYVRFARILAVAFN